MRLRSRRRDAAISERATPVQKDNPAYKKTRLRNDTIRRWVSAYATELRDEAARRSKLWPGDPLASALSAIANEIEERATAYAIEALTLEQAADESGYSYAHVQRTVSEGAIDNVGEPGAPRIRRGDLPRKAGRGPTLRAEPGDLADEILARRAR